MWMYDDQLVIVSKQGGAKKVASFTGSTDPGKYWTDKSFNGDGKGCAHMIDGQYRYGFVNASLDWDSTKTPYCGQMSKVWIWRDKNKDGTFQEGESVQEGKFGILIHIALEPVADLDLVMVGGNQVEEGAHVAVGAVDECHDLEQLVKRDRNLRHTRDVVHHVFALFRQYT